MALDAAARTLVRLSAAIAAGTEGDVRGALQECMSYSDQRQVEEVILQSYLFSGFPRMLNAAREWRRISGSPAPSADTHAVPPDEVRVQGERTCETVYGSSYIKLRENVRSLHPAMDTWMVEEGYGKVLSRGGLALELRELCIVAACAASRQDRQLHSHLHGALNAGASDADIGSALEHIGDLLGSAHAAHVRMLWGKVRKSRES